MHVIDLTKAQYERAKECGRLRDSEARKSGKRPGHGLDVDLQKSIELNVFGAAAEYATAIALNVEWDASVNTYKRVPDIAPDIDVRRRSTWKYDMLVRPSDRDGRRMVHVIGERRRYYVCGWKWTHDCRRAVWERTYGNRDVAYFVPLRYLIPFGASVWHPEDRVTKVFEDHCDHCGQTRRLVGVRSPSTPHIRIDCSYCNKALRFD